jgi:hypothetical protein
MEKHVDTNDYAASNSTALIVVTLGEGIGSNAQDYEKKNTKKLIRF